MTDSPERAAARQAVGDAIRAYAELTDLADDQVVGDWAVVAHLPRLDNPGDSTYLAVFPSAYVPSHVGTGLFSVGIDVVNHDGWTEGDDDA